VLQAGKVTGKGELLEDWQVGLIGTSGNPATVGN